MASRFERARSMSTAGGWSAATRTSSQIREARVTRAARLLAGGLLPTVWVPPMEVRELRGLLAHRQRLVWQRTRTRNRLRAVLIRHSLVAPEGETS